MESQARYYEHSGVVPVVGLALMAAGAGIAAHVLGWIYGLAIYWVPFIYLNVVFTLVLAAGVGTTVGFLAKAGKIRSGGLCALVALAAGVIAQNAQWQAWLGQYLEPAELLELGGPLGAIPAIAEYGAWSVFGWTPAGWSLWAIWGVEGVIIVGGIAAIGWAAVAETPFCERCERWVDSPMTIAPFDYVHDADRLKASVDAGDLSAIRAMEKVRAGATMYAALDLYECQQCHTFRLLTVKNVERKQDGDGKEELDDTPIVQNLIVDSSTYDELAKKVVDE